jgi:hypothetical protein
MIIKSKITDQEIPKLDNGNNKKYSKRNRVISYKALRASCLLFSFLSKNLQQKSWNAAQRIYKNKHIPQPVKPVQTTQNPERKSPTKSLKE